MASPTLNERLAEWKRAFDVVSAELTTEDTRAVLKTLQTRQPEEGESAGDYLREQLSSAQRVASMVSANQRTAALVAAALVPGTRIEVEYPE